MALLALSLQPRCHNVTQNDTAKSCSLPVFILGASAVGCGGGETYDSGHLHAHTHVTWFLRLHWGVGGEPRHCVCCKYSRLLWCLSQNPN